MTDYTEQAAALRTRAAIRREAAGRRSVQEGKPDRLADQLNEAAASIERLHARDVAADEARAENLRLRAALAHSDQPCVYCTLPAAEFVKCAHGFPGCARADDMLGCPMLHDAHAAVALRACARALVDKLDECEPHITARFIEAAIRGDKYDGPSYAEELKALREALE